MRDRLTKRRGESETKSKRARYDLYYYLTVNICHEQPSVLPILEFDCNRFSHVLLQFGRQVLK